MVERGKMIQPPPSSARIDVAPMIWSSTVMGLAIITGICYQAQRSPEETAAKGVIYGLAVLAAATWAAGWLIPKGLREKNLQRHGAAGDDALQGQWQSPFLVSYVIRLVLFELSGVLAFIATVISGDIQWVTGFASIAILSLVLNFPSPSFRATWHGR